MIYIVFATCIDLIKISLSLANDPSGIKGIKGPPIIPHSVLTAHFVVLFPRSNRENVHLGYITSSCFCDLGLVATSLYALFSLFLTGMKGVPTL